MDGVTDVRFCIEMGKLGGFGVINLEGIQTRYENPSEVLDQVVKADKDEVTELIQKLYLEPIKEELIGRRVEELKKGGVLAAVSSIPQKAERFGASHRRPGRIFSWCNPRSRRSNTFRPSTNRWTSPPSAESMSIPVIIGNAVTYNVTLQLMECGVAGVLDWRGPRRGLHQPRRAWAWACRR